MKRYAPWFLGGIGAVILATFFLPKSIEKREGIAVVASFYPLAHFAEVVGGDRVHVHNLTAAGAEPHDYEPTPQDIVRVQNADIILINGAGFEPWFSSLEDTGVLKGNVVSLAGSIDMLPVEEEDHGEEEHDHGHEAYDPHFWLDPVRAQKEVDSIRDALVTADPAGRAVYEKNAADYKEKLAALANTYERGLGLCRLRTIIVPHNAFQYLGNRYSVEIESISGMSPDEEPSPKRMAELAEIAKVKGVRYIFFEETLVSPKLAETIAKEAGIETLVLSPVEGLTEDEIRAGENYISLMEKNLVQLQKALDCK